MEEYEDLEYERQQLEMDLENKSTFGVKTGHEVSAVVACILSVIIILGTVSMYLSDKAPY